MLFKLRRAFNVNWTILFTTARLVLYHVRARWDSTNSERHLRDAARVLTGTLERLGGTYVKLAQILAMRPDFLPLVYIEELSRLLDDVKPFPTSFAVNILEQDLSRPLRDCFRSFPDGPIASASFGQVYRAELLNGEVVAVKVRRPGIERIVRADLQSMKVLAWLLDLSTLFMTVSMRDFYTEFREYTAQELDYQVEARHIERIRRNAEGSEIVRVPRVYTDLTTSRVLCLEFLDGIWVNEILTALNAGDQEKLTSWKGSGLDLYLVSIRLIYVLMKEAFIDGVFHADPHAANIVVMKGNVIGLVDFGIIGTIGGDYQENMFQFMRRLGDRSAAGAFAAMLRVLAPAEDVDLKSFKREYEANTQRWIDAASDPGATISEKTAGKLIVAQLSLLHRYRLHLPRAVSRYYRALLIADSVANQLTPKLDMAVELRKVLSRLSLEDSLEQLTPAAYLHAFLGYQKMLLEIPRMFAEIADSRVLESSLRAVRSLDAGWSFLKRRLMLLISGALRLFTWVLAVLTVVCIWKGWHWPPYLPQIAFRGWMLGLAEVLTILTLSCWWAARWLRARVGMQH